jgi:hypothetical protein
VKTPGANQERPIARVNSPRRLGLKPSKKKSAQLPEVRALGRSVKVEEVLFREMYLEADKLKEMNR